MAPRSFEDGLCFSNWEGKKPHTRGGLSLLGSLYRIGWAAPSLGFYTRTSSSSWHWDCSSIRHMRCELWEAEMINQWRKEEQLVQNVHIHCVIVKQRKFLDWRSQDDRAPRSPSLIGKPSTQHIHRTHHLQVSHMISSFLIGYGKGMKAHFCSSVGFPICSFIFKSNHLAYRWASPATSPHHEFKKARLISLQTNFPCAWH